MRSSSGNSMQSICPAGKRAINVDGRGYQGAPADITAPGRGPGADGATDGGPDMADEEGNHAMTLCPVWLMVTKRLLNIREAVAADTEAYQSPDMAAVLCVLTLREQLL